MKQFVNVLKFEYLSTLKSKAFRMTTVLLLAVSLIFAVLPTLMDVIGDMTGSNQAEETITPGGQQGEDSNGGLKAAIIDTDGAYDNELLADFFPEYEWIRLSNSDEAVSTVENNDDYQFALEISGSSFTLYSKGSESFGSGPLSRVEAMIKTVETDKFLAEKGLSENDIAEFYQISVSSEVVLLSKDIEQTFWFAYVLLFLLYITTIMYGSMILTAVATEKSTKTMEILITSVKPSTLLFGKVFGAGLAGLTQFALLIAVNAVSLNVNLQRWLSFAPDVGEIMKFALSSNLFIFLIIFFLLGFFIYAFAYAAFGSMVSRLEEANSVAALPMILIIATFLLSFTGMLTPNELHIKVLSFVPFFSPMMMFMRMCVTSISTLEVTVAIVINVLSILLVGVLAARIYKVGVMLYGTAPKLTRIFKYMFKG